MVGIHVKVVDMRTTFGMNRIEDRSQGQTIRGGHGTINGAIHRNRRIQNRHIFPR
jgi:hypothetical protein